MSMCLWTAHWSICMLPVIRILVHGFRRQQYCYICDKFLQKQYIGFRNVSFKVWHCCLLLSSLGLFSFYYCYCWYMIVVRRPLLPFPSCSSSSWPFPPLYSECWTNMASCLDPVVVVSVLAPGVLFMRVYSLCGPGLCMCIICYGGRLSC